MRDNERCDEINNALCIMHPVQQCQLVPCEKHNALSVTKRFLHSLDDCSGAVRDLIVLLGISTLYPREIALVSAICYDSTGAPA